MATSKASIPSSNSMSLYKNMNIVNHEILLMISNRQKVKKGRKKEREGGGWEEGRREGREGGE